MSDSVEPLTAESALAAKLALIRSMSPPPDGPARNGYAAELIARNAADGAARKGPAMIEPITDQLAATLRRYFAQNVARPVTNDLVDEAARAIVERYDVNRREFPTEEQIGLAVENAANNTTWPNQGRAFMAAMSELGYSIVRTDSLGDGYEHHSADAPTLNGELMKRHLNATIDVADALWERSGWTSAEDMVVTLAKEAFALRNVANQAAPFKRDDVFWFVQSSSENAIWHYAPSFQHASPCGLNPDGAFAQEFGHILRATVGRSYVCVTCSTAAQHDR